MKRAVAFLVVVTMLVAAVGAVGLSDIAGHWAEGDISALVDKGIIKGLSDTEYAPNENMTRAQFVAIMNRAFPNSVSKNGAEFDDVSVTDWFYDDVMKGLVNGMGEGIFGANLPISRQDACVLVVRYMGNEEEYGIPSISDYDSVADYAKDAVAMMMDKGIVGGYPDGTFNPLGLITRAEVASIINRALSGGGGAPIIDEPQPEPAPKPLTGLAEFVPSKGESTYKFKGEEFYQKANGTALFEKFTALLQYELGDWYSKEPNHSSTTSGAIRRLVNGEKDIVFVTYPSEEDFALAKSKGVELEGAAFAQDALVFMLNPSNLIRSLTSEEIKKIYSGEKDKWEGIDRIIPAGKTSKITAYRSLDNPDVRAGLLEFMGDTPVTRQEEDWFETEKRGIYYAFAADIGGITYFYRSSLAEGEDASKTCVSVDGIEPSDKAIKNGEYPIMVKYYAIIRKDSPEGSFERELLKYVLSPDGQQLVKEAGYVEI